MCLQMLFNKCTVFNHCASALTSDRPAGSQRYTQTYTHIAATHAHSNRERARVDQVVLLPGTSPFSPASSTCSSLLLFALRFAPAICDTWTSFSYCSTSAVAHPRPVGPVASPGRYPHRCPVAIAFKDLKRRHNFVVQRRNCRISALQITLLSVFVIKIKATKTQQQSRGLVSGGGGICSKDNCVKSLASA